MKKAALLVFPATLVCALGGAAAPPGARSPGWTRLTMHASKLFLSARTSVGVQRIPAPEAGRRLCRPPAPFTALAPTGPVVVVETRSELPFGKTEDVTALLDAVTGAVLQTVKVTRHHHPYWKRRRFGPSGYVEWRREPAAGEDALPPERWTRRSEKTVTWSPPPPAGSVVTSSYALPYLLSVSNLDRPGASLHVLVSTRGRLVAIDFRSGKLFQVPSGFTVVGPGGRRRRRKPVQARAVLGTARYLGGRDRDEPADTGFMGMRGAISVLLDRQTGAPVEISGRAKGIGLLRVRLDTVTPAR